MKKYKELLELARESIESQLTGKRLEVSEDIKNKYSKKQACFVTLTINGELRGCIGSLEAHQELWKDIVDNARSAAFYDTRFLALTKEELNEIKIEISVLKKPVKLGVGERIFSKIDNKMGLILRKGFYSATFLPQVWEQIPDKKGFLENLSIKAGLDKDVWKGAEIEFYRVESVEE
ncbi:AmmeMemoRadiSam system protein A [Candidatus Pacearchaeota archaeon]|nr:AmmeMemoRadiSam system protein A [Candidatus Pacearchaeota archaeon]